MDLDTTINGIAHELWAMAQSCSIEDAVTPMMAELLSFALTIRADEFEQLHIMREALTELRDRIKGHPAYESLTETEEIEIGGDTAELSYLARVADEALSN